MGAWGTSIFSDDLAQDIRREYNFLLSIGKENREIEETLKQYYSSILNCNDPDEDVFWFALALSEWKKGRLSSAVKEKALSALDVGRDLERWNTLGNKKNYEKRLKALKEFKNIILSPMPVVKKQRKPTVHHCPWKVGSLLAYRIVANKWTLEGHPCYLKYVLLRIIKIVKNPISAILPTEYYDEMMLVGLYNWIGDEIPDPQIAKHLEFIPIKEYTPTPPVNAVDLSLLNSLPEESRKSIANAIISSFEKKIVTCAYLDWQSTKDIVGDITYLDCDESYEHNIPNFFDTSIFSCPLTNYASFDITVAKRMECYFGENL